MKEVDPRATRNRVSKEEWVINCVTRIVGTKAGPGFVKAGDVVSDITLMLLDTGGFNWEEEEVEAFCQRKASYMVMKYLRRKERSECEFVSADGTLVPILDIASYVPAHQETAMEAHDALARLKAIPDKQRQALEVLCDGGNPIDVAEEMGIKPWAAIALIKEGREYVDRVDPL